MTRSRTNRISECRAGFANLARVRRARQEERQAGDRGHTDLEGVSAVAGHIAVA